MKFLYTRTLCFYSLLALTIWLDAGRIERPIVVSQVVQQVHSNCYSRNAREGEFVIDTEVTFGPATDHQTSPSVAFDGTHYMIVWADRRSGTSYGIYGARINQMGALIDTVGFPISVGAYDKIAPSIIFDGVNYFVAWEDFRQNYAVQDIYGTRVTTSGSVLDTNGIQISYRSSNTYCPSIACDDINYLVVWADATSGQNIYGARVTKNGILLDTINIPICTDPGYQNDPSVCFDGTNYFVVWHDGLSNLRDIYGVRVDQSGLVLDTSSIAICTANEGQIDPSVAFDGTNCLVIWLDHRNTPASYIYGARVNQSAVVLDTNGFPICGTAVGHPLVTFDGSNYLAVWVDQRSATDDIYATRVSPAGIVLDPSGIAVSTAPGEQTRPAVIYGNTNYLAVWEDYRDTITDVYGTRLNSAGVVLDPSGILMSVSTYSQYSPAVAFNGTDYLVVWEDLRNISEIDIYGARVSQSGAVLDTSAIAISTAPDDQYSPSVVSDGTDYLVVWEDKRSGLFTSDIYGARVNQFGIVLDTSGIPICTAAYRQRSPSVSSDGTHYFVVWDDDRNGSYDVFGARVSQSGVVLDTSGLAISTAANSQTSPSVTFDGSNYLVVWRDSRYGAYMVEIFGSRVSQSGTIIDSAGFMISNGTWGEGHPAAAFGNTSYLVIWEDYRYGRPDIYGARVTQTGIVIDTNGIVISSADHSQAYPVVCFDGGNYVVLWEDGRTGVYDIFAAKIDTSGAMVDSFGLMTQEGNQLSPALIRSIGEQLFITYSGNVDSIAGYPVNVMRIWGKFYPFVGTEEENRFFAHDIGLNLNIYPNPVHQECIIKYSMQTKTRIIVSMYDVTGRLAREVINEIQDVGIYSKTIDMMSLPQGVYFIKLHSSSQSKIQKIIFLK